MTTKKTKVIPLDAVKDFDEPVKKQGTLPGVEAGDDEPTHAKIQDGFVLMNFVRLKPIKEKDGGRFLGIELAAGITDEHAKLLGPEIEEAYGEIGEWITGLDLELPAHLLTVSTAADMTPMFSLSVIPARCSLQEVQEKGSGEERTIVRLSFLAAIPQTNELALWACQNHGTLVWVKMAPQQGKLIR